MNLLRYIVLFLPVVQCVIQGINFYGLETPSEDLVCSWQNPPSYYLHQLNGLGFNSIRLPFSYEWATKGDFSKMDAFFDTARSLNMSIVLDMHRVWSSHQGPNPTEGISLDQFIQQWTHVISRYESRAELTGIDVFNEDQGTDAEEWNGVLRQITTAIESAFPNRFSFFCGGTRWGGDISGINIEDVPFHDRVIYTIHKYSFSSSSNYQQDWDYSFGPFAHIPGKVSVGEFGWKQDQPDQVQWAQQFIQYLKRRDIRNDYFWTLALSGDTSGLYQDDCQTFQWDKFNLLKVLWETRSLRGMVISTGLKE